jgi:hypothetical protein
VWFPLGACVENRCDDVLACWGLGLGRELSTASCLWLSDTQAERSHRAVRGVSAFRAPVLAVRRWGSFLQAPPAFVKCSCLERQPPSSADCETPSCTAALSIERVSVEVEVDLLELVRDEVNIHARK